MIVLYIKALRNYYPANKIIISSKNLTSKTDCYWSANDIFTKKISSNKHLDYKDAVGQIHSMLNESVRGQMLADVPIGSFLSGGIDSSLITALMQEKILIPELIHFLLVFKRQNLTKQVLQKLLQLILAQNILSFISRRMKLEKLFLRWLQSTLNLC